MKKTLMILTLLLTLGISTLNVSLGDQGDTAIFNLNGSLIPTADLTVTIFTTGIGGSPFYNETFIDAIQNGSWNIMLGNNTSIPLPLDQNVVYFKDYAIDGEDLDFTDTFGNIVERQFFFAAIGQIQPGDVNSTGFGFWTQNVGGELEPNNSQDLNIRQANILNTSFISFDIDGDTGIASGGGEVLEYFGDNNNFQPATTDSANFMFWADNNGNTRMNVNLLTNATTWLMDTFSITPTFDSTDVFRVNNDLGTNVFSVSSLIPVAPGGGVLLGTAIDMGGQSIFDARQLQGRAAAGFTINTEVATAGTATRDIILQSSDEAAIFTANVNRLIINSGASLPGIDVVNAFLNLSNNTIQEVQSIDFTNTSTTITAQNTGILQVTGDLMLDGDATLYGGPSGGEELILRPTLTDLTPLMSLEGSSDVTIGLADMSFEFFQIQDLAFTPNILLRVTEIGNIFMDEGNISINGGTIQSDFLGGNHYFESNFTIGDFTHDLGAFSAIFNVDGNSQFVGNVNITGNLTVNNTESVCTAENGLCGVIVSPLTTKGDLYTRNSTADNRLPVGTNNDFLIANSSADNGISWFAPVKLFNSSEGESSTTSTTFQQKLVLFTGTIPAGDYLVEWYVETKMSNGNTEDGDVRVRVNDTTDIGNWEVTGFVITGDTSAVGRYHGFSGFQEMTLGTGAHNITIDFSANSGDTTFVRKARLRLEEIL